MFNHSLRACSQLSLACYIYFTYSYLMISIYNTLTFQIPYMYMYVYTYTIYHTSSMYKLLKYSKRIKPDITLSSEFGNLHHEGYLQALVDPCFIGLLPSASMGRVLQVCQAPDHCGHQEDLPRHNKAASY